MTPAGPVGGNALDVALGNGPGASLASTGGYERLGSLPFDRERQLASVLVRPPAGSALLITKGAPEAVLARCTGVPAKAAGTLQELFADGARVVAVGTRDMADMVSLAPADERDLRLAGFLTFVDRPKADAGASIAQLNRLGITVKIITGDNGTVAAKVCRR